jgi:hypothetical protein
VVLVPSEQHGQQGIIRPLGCLLSTAHYGQDTEIHELFVFVELYQSYMDQTMLFAVWVFLILSIFGVW